MQIETMFSSVPVTPDMRRQPSPWGDLSLHGLHTDLQVLRGLGEPGLVRRLTDTGIGEEHADTLSRQLIDETKIGRSGNFTTVTIGTNPKDVRFKFFFQGAEGPTGDKMSTGMRKVGLPPQERALQIGSRLPKEVAAPKILLINAQSPEYPVVTAPLGIITLGGHLKTATRLQPEITYVDMQLEPTANVIEQINGATADLVGISLKVGGDGIMHRLMDEMELQRPDGTSPLIVLGNALPTNSADQIHHNYPQVVCAIGRGEMAMEGLVKMLVDGKPIDELIHVPGISFVVGDTIFETAGNETSAYDSLPDWPALFDKYEPRDYQEIWGAESSYGCPQKRDGHGCTYCAITPHGSSRAWIGLPEDKPVREMRVLAEYGAPHIRLPDEEFAAGQPERALELAQSLVGLRQELGPQSLTMPTFDFAIRVDDVSRRGPRENRKNPVEGQDEPMSQNDLRRAALATFKEAGLTQVYVGLESGSDRQLKRMHKAARRIDNEKAVEVLRELGIQVAGGWIMLDPEMEGLEDLKENIDFIEKMKLIPTTREDDFITSPINRMRVLHGSPLVDHLHDKGLLGPLKDNMIEYEFEYADPVIGSIAGLLETWEEELHPLRYAVKNSVANARLTGDVRDAELDDYFFGMKALDFAYIKQIVGLYDTTPGQIPPQEQIDALVEEFTQRRSDIVVGIRQGIDSGTIGSKTVVAGMNQVVL